MSSHAAKLAFCALMAAAAIGQDAAKTPLKQESFDRDPGWDALNNRVVPNRIPTVTQDFGYGPAGQVGGLVTRTMRPAFYAEKLEPKTLNDKLSASGAFTISSATGGGGVFFGWFNEKQPEGAGRPIGSLGLHLDTESKGGRLAVRLITGGNQGAGTFVTPFGPYRSLADKAEKRPTPIRFGARYAWSIDYDPEANQGNGRFQVTVKGDGDKPEEWEGKVFTVDLPPGYRKDGATFDRFGLANMTKPGGHVTLHFGDLKLDGRSKDLSRDPGWTGSGNRAKYEEPIQVGAHDFGYSGKTSHAGGGAGEAGGDFWRSGSYAYYADRVGPLSLEDRLEARGRVVLKVGAPDSDMFLGWFDSSARELPPVIGGHFLGVHVGGPTRVGHYFQPALTAAKGTRVHIDAGPVMAQEKAYEWSVVYDPAGNGTIKVTLGGESVTLTLKPGQKAEGASFDRFGLSTTTIGGQLIRLFVDDLRYTAAR